LAQQSASQQTVNQSQGDEHSHGKHLLGPLLCWAVVFADIGTSVYYTPGILYSTVGSLAGFFVFLTMSVFVLLTLKYAEVTHRFPQGGGVVTVAAQAMNHWVGALGGMFILVDYFLTAAISSLSGMQYLSVVIPALGPTIVVPVYGQVQYLLLVITIVVLVLLGILNWVGISESARVSLVGAIIAFISDIAILITVFTHISFSEFLSLFPRMFEHQTLTVPAILFGFAGSFLAFSGLESISQLSPVMKTPRKRVAGIALLLVVLTIGITSPLLTMLSTLLQPKQAADPVLSAQIISLLGDHFGGSWGIFLQTEVAISASALLVFASNTAIIGAYHVFMALSRMEFFPAIILRRNKLRGTPHYSIALATGVPVVVLILVGGNINILGDMYAFGLLGAFSLTCLGLDIVRHRERKVAKELARQSPHEHQEINHDRVKSRDMLQSNLGTSLGQASSNGAAAGGLDPKEIVTLATPASGESLRLRLRKLWYNIDFWLGILTTLLVMTAWSTNLIHKLLATAFGGTVTIIGMSVAFYNYNRHKQKGRLLVVTTSVEERLPGSILAVLVPGNEHNSAVMHSAISDADGKPVVFLYASDRQPESPPRLFEVYDPYLHDQQAKELFGQAESLAQKAKVARRYVYLPREPEAVSRVWHVVHPADTVLPAEDAAQVEDINPDRIRYELTPEGKVAHLIKRW
jgi:amino acid transporter